MIVLSGALVLVALVLLVFGALDRNLPYVYASIGVSVLSLLLLLVGILQRRDEFTGSDQDGGPTPVTDTSDERVPALVGAEPASSQLDPVTSELPVVAPVAAPQPARPTSSRLRTSEPPEEELDDDPAHVDEHDTDDDTDDDADDVEDHDEFDDDELEDELEAGGSGVTVLVVSGRPRYHLEGCRVLRGKEPQPLDRDDARTHGFSPCGVCRPDADADADAEADADAGVEDDAVAGRPDLVDRSTDEPQVAQEPAAGPSQAEQEQSFTETLFGGPLFTEARDGHEPGDELPDRPVQPEPQQTAPAPAETPAVDAPSELSGDDPADDVPSVGEDAPAPAPAPAPDVAGDPDELHGARERLAVVDAQPEREDEPSSDATSGDPAVEDGSADGATAAPVQPAAVPAAEVPSSDVEPADDVPGGPDGAAEVAAAPPTTAPARKRAARRAPAQAALSETGPTGAALDQAALVGRAAAEQASAERAPAKRTPAKRAPAKKAPAKKAATRASATEAAAESAPATGAATAQTPVSTPTVKRPVVRAVRADALRLGAPSTGATTTRVAARGAAPAPAAPVVVVPDRERFHRPECRFVRGVAGATTLPKASATRQGYAACGVCKP